MGHRFAEIAFTESVRDIQQAHGSRSSYLSMEGGEDYNHLISEQEAKFITERDSFYMASVSETGWPYVQHRGGPIGFMRVLDEKTIGFADFSGNRQYVSTGNFRKDNRVALFFMDYPNRRRLKLIGRVREIGTDDWDQLAQLEVDNYRARVERGFVIEVEGFDWNCPQHITPRYTESYIEELMAPLMAENQRLKENQRQKGHQDISDGPSKVTGQAVDQSIGSGPLELVVSGVRQLTPRVRTFELRHPEGIELPEITAGSHLRIPVLLPSGETIIRHYSICSNPVRRDIYEIAVLREEGGAGGSQAVHDQFNLGLTLRCKLPDNYFPLHTDDRPAVFIAGGIGITPIKAMAQAIKAQGRHMHLHYAGRNYHEMAFRDRLLREFGDDMTVYRSEKNERLDIHQVLSTAPDNTVIYVCGPGRLIDAVVNVAKELNIDPKRIRFERFTTEHHANDRPITVELARSDVSISVSPDISILDAMLEAGIDAPYSCGTGNCKTCAVKVVAGDPEHRDSVLTEFERQESQLMCPCVSRAVGDTLILDI